jgi:hypothetical protein
MERGGPKENGNAHASGVIVRHGRRLPLGALLLALVLAAVAASSPAADAAQAAPQALEFDIAHEGDIVGHHRQFPSGR